MEEVALWVRWFSAFGNHFQLVVTTPLLGVVVTYGFPLVGQPITPAVVWVIVGLSVLVGFYRVWRDEHLARVAAENPRKRPKTSEDAPWYKTKDAVDAWLALSVVACVLLFWGVGSSWYWFEQSKLQAVVPDSSDLIPSLCLGDQEQGCWGRNFALENRGEEAYVSTFSFDPFVVKTPNGINPDADANAKYVRNRLAARDLTDDKPSLMMRGDRRITTLVLRPLTKREMADYETGNVTIYYGLGVDLQQGLVHRRLLFCFAMRGNSLPLIC